LGNQPLKKVEPLGKVEPNLLINLWEINLWERLSQIFLGKVGLILAQPFPKVEITN